MDWKKIVDDKKMTAAEAVKKVKSGDRIVVGHACGEPEKLLEALVDNAESYKDVEIVHMVAMGPADYCKPEYKQHFRHNSLFLGKTTRKAIAEGRGDFTPVFFYEIPNLLKTTMHPDVAFIQVSPPDDKGYVSLGVSVDYTLAAAQCADLVIAQVNKEMPRTMGDSFLNVKDIDIIVEADAPIIELPPAPIGEIEKSIGKNCASLIQDGDTLQLGIGAIPDAVLLFLKDKKDLGIHSEMFSDGVVELVEDGIITNKKKTLNPGKMVATFLMGTKRLYDFVDNNPAVSMMPVNYVNDPYIIKQNDNLISINSCVQVDLQGQVVSTSVGKKEISGVGGQMDFVRGANMSKGGKSIMAMPSVTKKGVSKIVPFIDEGASVTTSRHDVGYVVTEFGIAELRDKTLREKARALINIAHPDARPELKEEFKARFHEEF